MMWVLLVLAFPVVLAGIWIAVTLFASALGGWRSEAEEGVMVIPLAGRLRDRPERKI